ncbi:Hypothetical protein A7982_01377 [Minicystis rosea]|nr:Hypothetical protein A7982_01377 [Minicystis rosea]
MTPLEKRCRDDEPVRSIRGGRPDAAGAAGDPADGMTAERLVTAGAQGQVKPQNSSTSSMQDESHSVEQQKSSRRQTRSAHESQLASSAVPVLHRSCAHEPELPHEVSPQTLATSPTHDESQDVEQQNESAAQTCATQVSHDALKLVPVAHLSCTHVVPPLELDEDDELDALELDEELLDEDELELDDEVLVLDDDVPVPDEITLPLELDTDVVAPSSPDETEPPAPPRPRSSVVPCAHPTPAATARATRKMEQLVMTYLEDGETVER